MKVLLAGGGYVGSALCARLLRRGAQVSLIKRTSQAAPQGAEIFLSDLSDRSSSFSFPRGIDALVYLLSADSHDDAAYRRAYVDALENALRLLEQAGGFRGRICFVSSTAVYGQTGGELVDESSPTEPQHFSGLRLLEAERLLESSRFQSCVLRLGGIYGPGRARLIEDVRTGRVRRNTGPPQFTNRIHRDDCAALIEHLVFLPQLGQRYLGVDCEPAARNDVFSWVAAQLGMDPPPEEELPGEPSRGNKRCSNRKILESGYIFQYPTFREGYSELLT